MIKGTKKKICIIAAVSISVLTAACANDITDVDGSFSVIDITEDFSSASDSEAASSQEASNDVTKVDTESETEENVIQEPGIYDPQEVSFSVDSGVYGEEFDLQLFSSGDGDIFYTTDGSDPKVSTTAVQYTAPIHISDRSGDKNVVSAVEPILISGNFNYINKNRDGFECDIIAPADTAVDKCTVIRAAVKNSSGEFEGESAATFFIGTTEEHIEGLADSCEAAGMDLAVISISMNYEDLFDNKDGIYVKGDIFDKALEEYVNEEGKIRDSDIARRLEANYNQRGREWEREAVITVFEFNKEGASEILTQDCGIRIQGNYSRSDLQKGFRLYARKDYGDNNFRYAFFGDDYVNDSGEVMDKFKTLVLRAGGNCAFTSKFNDTFWQSLVDDTACETKHSRPCVVYLNGEYWGLYVLEEDYSADFFEDLHGVNKDDVVVYKGDAETYSIGYKLDIGEIPDGERESYYFQELKDFFNSHSDLKEDDDYEEFIKLVDPDSVMDYFAVECWINNKWDWPGKNWSMWKTINIDPSNDYADGRWRFMFYDMEFGGVSGSSDAGTNTIKEDNYKPNGLLDMDTNNPAVLCFAYLMTNDGFRQRFEERLSGLSEGFFEQEKALSQLSYYEDVYSPLYDQFFRRYPGTGSTENAVSGGYASIQCIRDFLLKREQYIDRMISYCKRILG